MGSGPRGSRALSARRAAHRQPAWFPDVYLLADTDTTPYMAGNVALLEPEDRGCNFHKVSQPARKQVGQPIGLPHHGSHLHTDVNWGRIVSQAVEPSQEVIIQIALPVLLEIMVS